MDLYHLFIKKTEDLRVHLLRSVLASFVSFAIDYGIYVLLSEILGLYYIPAAVIGFLSGTTTLYFLSVLWVFKSRRVKNRKLEYTLFILFAALGLLLNIGLLAFFTEITGIHHLLSRLLAGTLGFVFNFLLRKLVLFSAK